MSDRKENLKVLGDGDADAQNLTLIFSLIEMVLNQLLLFLDPDYKIYFEESGGELNFEKMLEYIMYSDWYAFFSEDTLLMFGELVVYLSRDDYASAKELVEKRYHEDVEYFLSHLRIREWGVFLLQAFCYFVLMENGGTKVTPTSKYFTSIPWTIFGYILNLL